MNPSERIKIIKKVSEILGRDEWTFIDITLRQFKLPTQDTWNGNPNDYVAAMIEDASDQDLVELAKHLEISILEISKNDLKKCFIFCEAPL